MKVREFLPASDRPLVTAEPTETIEQAACRLRLANVGALVVLDETGRLAGVLSERDIIRAIVDSGPRALNMLAREVMDREPVVCSPDDKLGRVARLMTHRRVRHVPIVVRGRVEGVVSLGDVVKHRLEELETETEVLRDLAAAVV